MSVTEKMTALANAVREKTGITEPMGIDAMTQAIKSISSVITDIAKGSKINLSYSAETKLLGLKIFGKTTQNGTPSPDAPVPLVSAGDGGSIIVTIGTSESDANPQTLTVSTPNGLPGIHASDGGNYTDENGWQWICDEVDFVRGVYVQRCGVKVFDGSSDEPWGISGTNQSGVYRLRCNPSFFGNAIKPAEKNNTAANIMASNYPVVSAEATYKCQIGICIDTIGEVWLYDSRFTTSDKTGFLSYLAANPMRLVYELATPIETALTAEELAAYAALHTNYPNTIIFNDGGADMEVKYVVDTKNYIDNQTAMLANAILNS